MARPNEYQHSNNKEDATGWISKHPSTDHASRFIEECLKVGVGAGRVGARDLYNIFCRWSLENGFDDLVSENIFSRRMEERGLKKKRTKAGMEYEDVALASSTSTTF